jgi:hypothetical protein
MTAAHYVLFHPEKKRVQVQVKAMAFRQGDTIPNWLGDVWVDKPNGNEDPFVFVEPWVYTYCYATQLRREPRQSSHIQPGSYLIFCSGDIADEHKLCVDPFSSSAVLPSGNGGRSSTFRQNSKNRKTIALPSSGCAICGSESEDTSNTRAITPIAHACGKPEQLSSHFCLLTPPVSAPRLQSMSCSLRLGRQCLMASRGKRPFCSMTAKSESYWTT